MGLALCNSVMNWGLSPVNATRTVAADVATLKAVVADRDAAGKQTSTASVRCCVRGARLDEPPPALRPCHGADGWTRRALDHVDPHAWPGDDRARSHRTARVAVRSRTPRDAAGRTAMAAHAARPHRRRLGDPRARAAEDLDCSQRRARVALFFEFALHDVARAADLLPPAYDASGGRDGYRCPSPELVRNAASAGTPIPASCFRSSPCSDHRAATSAVSRRPKPAWRGGGARGHAPSSLRLDERFEHYFWR